MKSRDILKLLRRRIRTCHKDLLFSRNIKGYRKDWLEGIRSRLDELLLLWHEIHDVNFVDALAQIAGGAINMARYVKGLKSSIEVLKTMKEVQTQRLTSKTPL